MPSATVHEHGQGILYVVLCPGCGQPIPEEGERCHSGVHEGPDSDGRGLAAIKSIDLARRVAGAREALASLLPGLLEAPETRTDARALIEEFAKAAGVRMDEVDAFCADRRQLTYVGVAFLAHLDRILEGTDAA